MSADAQASWNGCFFPPLCMPRVLAFNRSCPQHLWSQGSLQLGQPTQVVPLGTGVLVSPHPFPNCSSQAALNSFG